MKLSSSLIGISAILFSHLSFGAGFNCSLASLSETEKAICADEYLSSLDNSMNKFFKDAFASSFSRGGLLESQKHWIAERNNCKSDLACIKSSYLARNKLLAGLDRFSPVRQVFTRYFDDLDPPQKEPLKTPEGFTIDESPWQVRRLLPNYYSGSQELQSFIINDVEVLGHRIIDGDLIIFVAVEGQSKGDSSTMILSLSDQSNIRILEKYSTGEVDRAATSPQSKDIVYSVTAYDGELEKKRWYEISISTPDDATVVKLDSAPAGKEWIGYCGTSECTSTALSPDGKWRLAVSADDSVNDEGMFYFPANHPDAGINVFLRKADNSSKGQDNGFGFMRNYTWGDKDTFYFDNDGGYACIWKTDIKSKTTTRILPVESILHPYYLKYAGKDYILASYRYYDKKYDKSGSELYLATP